MSKRSAAQKRKSKNTVVRNKREFFTERRARASLINGGVKPHRLDTPRHTGTYWRWELSR